MTTMGRFKNKTQQDKIKSNQNQKGEGEWEPLERDERVIFRRAWSCR